MPLHLIFQCCKCKNSLSHDLWSIVRNHKYADSKNVCSHFNVIIDHESSCGLLGFGWENYITIKAYCKINYCTKIIISRTFNSGFMEYQNYERFDNIICHARISDYKRNYPDCGFNLQKEIEYNERIEKQKREEMERKRQYERELELQMENMIERGKNKEEERQNELNILREESNKKKKKFKLHIKLIDLNIDKIFENMYDIKIEKL